MTEPRRQRQWRRPQTHTHKVRQPGTPLIVAGAALAIITFLVMILAIVGYLADRRAVAEDSRKRTDREISNLQNAVCDALAVTIMGATDPAVLARADAAGDELGCIPPPSERDVEGYPVPTPVPPTSTGAPESVPELSAPQSPDQAAAGAESPSQPPPARGSGELAPPPATVEPPAPAPEPSAPAPQPTEEPPPALLDPLLDPVCDTLGVCLGD